MVNILACQAKNVGSIPIACFQILFEKIENFCYNIYTK